MSNPVSYIKNTNSSIRRSNGNKVDLVIIIAEVILKLVNYAKGYYKENFSYRVSVSEGQAVYGEVNKWLLDILPNEKQRSISVYSDSMPHEIGEDNKVIEPLTVKFNDKSSRIVKIDGHKVEVQLLSPEVTDSKFYDRLDLSKKIQFTVYSHQGQKAILNHLEKLNQKRVSTRKGVLKMTNSWGDWTTRSDLPPRSLASVNLPDDQKNRIVKDLEDFLNAEDKYNELAIPFHRGFMFHGPPGTGKTSLAKALANHFNLDMWYISLSDLKTETSLMGLLSRVSPRSILLLEDIDTIKTTHDRDSGEAGEMTMASLLNALDGVATPHGLITIMTTNRFDILDSALTRAGRMDVIEELGYPTKTVVESMFWHFYKEPFKVDISENAFIEKEISTATLAEIMKRNLDNNKQARKDILGLFKE